MASTASMFKSMETQIGQLANRIDSRHQGSLPTHIETNPGKNGKKRCQEITLRSGKEFKEVAKKSMSLEFSAIIQKKLSPKLKYPGSYTINCMIGIHALGRALCDVGASINLMLYLTYKNVGVRDAKPTSVTYSNQICHLAILKEIEDVFVKVDKFIFPVDFVILDMEVDGEFSITFGRPFLTIGRILIDGKKGELKNESSRPVGDFDV
ncbi:hypothetical protein CDL12_28875 [Handroanthus impetiginosus]|uniref:Aspartic peptidase DDI1-type domain-containing protein n=1 Tax=Handroanthus impetiginosus TaxID=429701 RepID=A0A2G9G0C6_9LAMI|nr:hypothetical protein CDL12_28875 [Handroanthus impetiginosus]